MATPKTGRPRGRPTGAQNKRTVQREQATAAAAQKIAEVIGPKAFEGDAHAFLMSVYKDPSQTTPIRIDAAGKAIGYEKPKLATTELTGPDGGPVQISRIERVVIDAETDDASDTDTEGVPAAPEAEEV